ELNKYDHSGLLVVTPYYNKPNQNALIAHFSKIAQSTTKDIILYNVPGRTGCNMSAATTVKLASKFQNIVCIKEASGSMDQIMEIENNAPDDFYVVSGEDTLTLSMIAAGTKGVISVIAQAYPKQYSSMVKLALENKFDDARKLHYNMLDITNSIYDEGNPVGIKYLMSELNLCKNVVRLPLIAASDNLQDKIKGLMM
ncbi:MAG: 4-hydroxy-tetrahydrodipicolinate synthase, partial [Bacteroidia bacterium]